MTINFDVVLESSNVVLIFLSLATTLIDIDVDKWCFFPQACVCGYVEGKKWMRLKFILWWLRGNIKRALFYFQAQDRSSGKRYVIPIKSVVCRINFYPSSVFNYICLYIDIETQKLTHYARRNDVYIQYPSPIYRV